MWQVLYNIAVKLMVFLMRLLAPFFPVFRELIKGREGTLAALTRVIRQEDKVFWVHCASLGEFEQGRPVLERFKFEHPEYKVVLSFFSASGYRIRKDYPHADAVVYLPFDTPKAVKKFVHAVQPRIAVFVKYELWPNLLRELKRQEVRTLLISARFREDQRFFKSFVPHWFKAPIGVFERIFVQDKKSVELLQDAGYHQVVLAGDTRFDRVVRVAEQKKEVPYIREWVKDKKVWVCGSTWEKDEKLILWYLQEKKDADLLCILVPHEVDAGHIGSLSESIKVPYALYSVVLKEENIPEGVRVLVIDRIGYLSALYAYADIAYVGGGFGVGIHNITEAAVYNIPVIFGPNYHKFMEAEDLIDKGGAFSINDEETLKALVDELLGNEEKRRRAGEIAGGYIREHTGATERIIGYLEDIV